MSVQAVIEAARADLGYTENPPNSNVTKYGAAYGLQGQPWCVMALWFWFRQAGESSAFFGGAKTASCGTLYRWYKAQGLTVHVEAARPGDIVLLNFHGGKDPEHCGLILGTGDGWVSTIEGNTSYSYNVGSQDNGGCVAYKTRLYRNIVGVCRPMYKEEPKTDWEGHWAEEHIRWAMDKGLMTGYEDGTWQPDKPVTRAELAAVLHRLKGDSEK